MIAFPKPKDAPKMREGAYKTLDDGREICFTIGTAYPSLRGRKEYKRRKLKMLIRQKGLCCLKEHCPICPGALGAEESTFDHERGRGGGKRDDRISLPDGTWINGAAHALCNQWKGSRYVDYNRSFQDEAKTQQEDLEES